MKVSEAIDRLEVGDTVWVKVEVCNTDKSDQPLYVYIGGTGYKWLDNSTEISLAEPDAEKVEVPDFVAEWYESHKYDLEDAISGQIDHGHDIVLDTRKAFDIWFFDESDCPIETLIRMKDGYTVKPKRWVVKVGNLYFCGWEDTTAQFVMNTVLGEDESIIKYKNEGTASSVAKNLGGIAEAVATLVEGTVEEV